MEDNKMTIKDFVEKIKDEFDEENLIESIIKTHYVPLVVKSGYAQQIIAQANEKDGRMEACSLALYVSFIMGVLQLYTTLEVDYKNPMDEYDLLQEHDLIQSILAAIGKDVQEFQTVLNMTRDDYDKNHYSMVSVMERILGALSILEQQATKNPEKIKEYVKG